MLEGEIDKNMHGMEMIFNLSSAAVLIMSSFNRVLLLSLSLLFTSSSTVIPHKFSKQG